MAKKSTSRKTSRRSAALRDDFEDMPETSARGSRGASRAKSETASAETRDYKSMLKELAGNPAVRYVAGGIATAILTRVASNISEKYPEISRFISENLENVEGKLGDFRDSLNADSARQH